MGYKIGLPSLKLNNAGTKTKRCGSFKSVAYEALEERKGHDPDIDQSKSSENIYRGYRSAEELMEYSRKHVAQLKDKNGRSIRKDAVVMCVTILKPPAAMMDTLPRSEQIRFLDDAEEGLARIVGKVNIKSSATHFDELGAHRHVFHEPMTEDGRLCAKEVHNLKFFGRVNRELPALLREKGWDIEDCEMYDAAQQDYETVRGKNRDSGRSSARFKADAEQELQEIVNMVNETLAVAQEADIVKEEAIAERDMAIAQKDNALRECAATAKKARELLQTAQKLDHAVSGLQKTKTTLEDRIAVLKEQIVQSEEILTVVDTAIKEKKEQGVKQYSMADWERRIADAQKQQDKDKRIKDLEKKVNLFEAFLNWAPDQVKRLWEQFLNMINLDKKKKRDSNSMQR